MLAPTLMALARLCAKLSFLLVYTWLLLAFVWVSSMSAKYVILSIKNYKGRVPLRS
jgi:hypothetical protein